MGSMFLSLPVGIACSLYSDIYLLMLYCIKAVVCRLYEMLYPCICNVVISCWKSGAYGYVICRGGTDMCFVPGSGWKHLDLEQYRILGLTYIPLISSTLCRPLSLFIVVSLVASVEGCYV